CFTWFPRWTADDSPIYKINPRVVQHFTQPDCALRGDGVGVAIETAKRIGENLAGDLFGSVRRANGQDDVAGGTEVGERGCVAQVVLSGAGARFGAAPFGYPIDEIAAIDGGASDGNSHRAGIEDAEIQVIHSGTEYVSFGA